MKSRFTKASVAAALAAGLILAPGLSPAQAATSVLGTAGTSISGTSVKPPLSLGNGPVNGGGGTATTYGLWFVPCDWMGFRLC